MYLPEQGLSWVGMPFVQPRVDISHPQAAGLYTLCVFNENAGLPFELLTGTQAVQQDLTTAATWDPKGWSPAYQTYFNLNARPASVSSGTIFWIGYPGLDNNDRGRLLTTDNTSGKGVCLAVNSYPGSVFGLHLLFGSVAWIYPNPTINPPTNVLCFLAVTWSTAPLQQFYMRRYDTGVTDYKTMTSASVPQVGTGTKVALNGGSGTDIPSASSYYQMAGYAQRAWDRAELDSFSANPWSLFRPPDHWLYPSAGGSPVTVSMGGILITGTLGATAETVSTGQAAVLISDSTGATTEVVSRGQAAIQISDSVGAVAETVTVSLAGLLIADSLGGFSVSAGGSVSVSLAGIAITDSLGGKSSTLRVSLAAVQIADAAGGISTAGVPLVVSSRLRSVSIVASPQAFGTVGKSVPIVASTQDFGTVNPDRTRPI